MFLVKDGFLKFTFEVQQPVLLPDMRFMFLIYVFLIEMNVQSLQKVFGPPIEQ